MFTFVSTENSIRQRSFEHQVESISTFITISVVEYSFEKQTDIENRNNLILVTSSFTKNSVIIDSFEKQFDVEILNNLALSISTFTRNLELQTLMFKEHSFFHDSHEDQSFHVESSSDVNTSIDVVTFNEIVSFNTTFSSCNIVLVRTARKTLVIAKKIESNTRKIIKLLKIKKTIFRVERK